MTLHKVFENSHGRVYGIFVNSALYYFYEGFESVEKAKSAIAEVYIADKIHHKPNIPKCVIEAEINMLLDGIWSEIRN